MSIWGTIATLDSGDPDCHYGDPWQYHHSNILPELDGPRGGGIDLADLNAYVRHYLDEGPHPFCDKCNDATPEPWLRLSVWSTIEDATVILSADQVLYLIDEMATWYRRATGKSVDE